MGAALWVAMVAALKSPTVWIRWGSFGEVSFDCVGGAGLAAIDYRQFR